MVVGKGEGKVWVEGLKESCWKSATKRQSKEVERGKGWREGNGGKAPATGSSVALDRLGRKTCRQFFEVLFNSSLAMERPLLAAAPSHLARKH